MVRRLCCLAAVLILFAPAAFPQVPCPTSATAGQPTGPDGGNFNTGSNIPFTWTASTVSGVTYDVLVGPNVNSLTVVCANQTGTNCSATINTAGSYIWVLKTKKTSCSDIANGPKTFTVGCLSGAPSIQSPSNNATNVATNVTLTWSGVSGADGYDIYLGTQTCGVNGQLASSSTTSFTPPTLTAGTTYGWRVVAKKTGCPSTTSSCGLFTTAGCNAPGSFDLRSPNNLTTSSTPTLSWNGASGAFKYLVRIGTSNPPSPTANDPLVANTSYTPTSPLSPGTYFWYVDAYPSCSSQLSTRSSSTFTFTVRS